LADEYHVRVEIDTVPFEIDQHNDSVIHPKEVQR